MGAQAPNLPPVLPSSVDELPSRELFTGFVVSGAPRSARSRVGAFPVSLAVHGIAAVCLLLVPLFWGDDDLPLGSYQLVMLNPPPPPPPPLAMGSPKTKPEEVKKQPDTPPEKATPKPQMEFVAPQEEKPITPEPSTAQPDPSGDEEGELVGDPDGMIGGTEGGTVGGVYGGALGGQIGGTGAVADYDQPPRPVRITKPVYTQEGFIKKIEGTVVLEILIDVTGRVARHRIVESIPALDRAAVECVYQWVFVPAIKQGRPVPTLAMAPVNFRIH